MKNLWNSTKFVYLLIYLFVNSFIIYLFTDLLIDLSIVRFDSSKLFFPQLYLQLYLPLARM